MWARPLPLREHVRKSASLASLAAETGLASLTLRQESYKPYNLILCQLKLIPEIILCMKITMCCSMEGLRPRRVPASWMRSPQWPPSLT